VAVGDEPNVLVGGWVGENLYRSGGKGDAPVGPVGDAVAHGEGLLVGVEAGVLGCCLVKGSKPLGAKELGHDLSFVLAAG